MTDARISQIASVALVQTNPPVRASQIAIVTPTVFASAGVRVSQLVSIALVEGPRVKVVPLEALFKLPCFVPCVPVATKRY